MDSPAALEPLEKPWKAWSERPLEALGGLGSPWITLEGPGTPRQPSRPWNSGNPEDLGGPGKMLHAPWKRWTNPGNPWI
eukprot:5232622-Pyramimonas_sp.AAC.1